MTSAVPTPRTSHEASVGDALGQLEIHVDVVSCFMFAVPFWAAHALHYDTAAAVADGFDAPLIPGALMSAHATRVLVEWAGDPRFVRRVTSRNLVAETAGATLVLTGRVIELEPLTAGTRATCAVRVASRGVALMDVTGIVELPHGRRPEARG